MFLKRLELVGFKSFAPRTTTELLPGIVVIVGPNGSGKSNIADSLRWVLGEQSARAVRARRPEEVIFAGSASRQPLGMAEVSLVLDNTDGTLPLEYAEVRVTRRLYRSGDSEYLLNGARVRLRDITQQLLHAGLGTDSYSVIGQGSVDELILQRPDERRVAFENAADIRRHQLKLADTRSRLASTQANLVRVQDVIAELAPHVRRLKTQAERASRAESVRSELQELLLHTFRVRLRQAQAAREAAERDLEEATDGVLRAEAEGQAADELLRTDDRLLGRLETDQAALRPRVATLRERAQAAERGLAVTRERLAGSTEQQVSLQQELERLTQQIARLSKDDRAPEPRELAVSDVAELETLRRQVAQELTPALQAAQHARAEVLLRRERIEQQIRAAELRLAHAEAQQRNAEAARAVQAAREADRTARIAALEKQLPRLVEEHTDLQARLDAARAELARAAAARRAAAERVERAREAARAASQHADRLQGALAALGAPEPSPPGAAELPEEWRAALEGIPIVGLAGELAARARPIDRLLRGYLRRTLVVQDAAAAREAHRRLSELLPGDAPAWAILSLDGLLLGAPGERPVEAGAADGASVLADWRRRIEQQRLELAAAEQRRAAAEADFGTARQALEPAERDERAARASIGELEGLVQHARRTQTSATSELAQLKKEQARAQSADRAARGHAGQPRPGRSSPGSLEGQSASSGSGQLDAADTPATPLELDAVTLARQALAAARREREAIAEQSRQAEAEMAELADRLAAARARLSVLETAEAQRRAEVQAGEALRTRIRSELEAAVRARGSAEQRLANLAVQATELAEREASLVEELRGALLELAPLEEQLGTAERQRLDVLERRRATEQRLASLRTAERAARERREACLLASQRATDDLERLDQEIADAAELIGFEADSAWVDQLRLDLSTTESAEPDLEVARRRITALQRELRAVGGVAESVVEEYRELSDRHDFLSGQADDLRLAMAELERASEELEGSLRERFAEVFAATQRAFQACFQRLFGGGEAQLLLTDPDDLLRSGIDIAARPPGKKLQNLLSLSGGERALTIVALLFGLLQVNPTPFCVLDEVDAALDESNVQRFADLLADFSRQIQFLVVTHNRATMDKADALYGVSMDDQGISRIFSIQPATLARRGTQQSDVLDQPAGPSSVLNADG